MADLDLTHIAKSKNCMSLLELAMQTYKLHQHISKEEIQKIYEEFSSKIETYFNQIVKNIEIQFENRNTLDTLESSMNQMDLLRGIVSIAHRTNLTYHNTIQKLINYVYQIKQEVDEFLRVFFQHESKGKHQQLRKVLFDLQNAQWIEKYWQGFHKNIIDNLKHPILAENDVKKYLENYDNELTVLETLLNSLRILNNQWPNAFKKILDSMGKSNAMRYSLHTLSSITRAFAKQIPAKTNFPVEALQSFFDLAKPDKESEDHSHFYFKYILYCNISKLSKSH